MFPPSVWKHQRSSHTEVTSSALFGVLVRRAIPTSTPCSSDSCILSTEELALFIVYWLKAYSASCKQHYRLTGGLYLPSAILAPLLANPPLYQPTAFWGM